jgi:hypothetical protein
VYRASRGSVAFVTVIVADLNGRSPTEIYSSWLHKARTKAHALPGIAHAYTVGTAVVALRDGSMVTTNVFAPGESSGVVRGESMRIASPVLQELK